MTGRRDRPVLRSPPFPWVTEAVAAVSRRATPQRSDVADVDPDTLFATIREARVGGRFWSPPRPVPGSPVTVIAPRDRAQLRAMRSAVGPSASSDIAIVSGNGRHVDPWHVLAHAKTVVADADDELAALALIADVPVRLFGTGRFGNAETGVSRDAVVRHLTVDTSYRDPFDGRDISVTEAIALLAFWREIIDANRKVMAAVGIAWWKRRAVRQFLWVPERRRIAFHRRVAKAARVARKVETGAGLAAWPSRVDATEIADARATGTDVALIEDGFLRSNGLGSALHRPWSITLDWRAAHFDADHPSDLETLLMTRRFDAPLLARAAALRETIVASGLGKYGTDPVGRADLVSVARSRRRVLAIGQVRNDESLRLGGRGLEDPLAFLKAVRAAEPDAEIWFRPHPDVEAGFREGAIPDDIALAYADRIVRSGSLRHAMAAVDAVHVVTSLAGFEALLAGHEVIVHGVPFYSGWSLTRDLRPCPRRTRVLSIDELVAGALILYPRYLDPVTVLPCPPEILVGRLVAGDRQRTFATMVRALDGVRRRLLRR